MPTAILIDGAYFVRRFRLIEPHNSHNATRAADLAFRWALVHLEGKKPKESSGGGVKGRRELYRIFFYDCPPVEKKFHNPISKKGFDASKSPEALFRRQLHQCLTRKRKVALRLGHLSGNFGWTIKPPKISSLLKGEISMSDLTEEDVKLDVRQKGVDMKIGLDIASLSYKKQVDQIVLIAGDTDFVPAAKMARREGIDFILDPMWQSIPDGLLEHVDGLRSTCPKPKGNERSTI